MDEETKKKGKLKEEKDIMSRSVAVRFLLTALAVLSLGSVGLGTQSASTRAAPQAPTPEAPPAEVPHAPNEAKTGAPLSENDASGEQRTYGTTPNNPLTFALNISLDEANRLLAACGCPGIPATGEASQEHLLGTWLGKTKTIGFEYRSGLQISFSPDERSPENYAADAAETIAGGFWDARLIPLRGRLVAVSDRDAAGPASASWIEGGHLVTVIGGPEHTLDTVISIAQAMPAAQ